MEHPLWYATGRRIACVGGTLCVALLQATLLYEYAAVPFRAAVADALFSSLFLAVLVYLSWFIVHYVEVRNSRWIVGFSSLLCWIAGCSVFQQLLMQLTGWHYASFAVTLLLRLSFALPVWVAVMVWYQLEKKSVDERNDRQAAEKEPAPKTVLPVAEDEYLDRISVKDGARIHLLRASEVLYIQACGDYVTLFAPAAQYVKEQTMKYFETHLPPEEFVRIHRSTLVNVAQISRVELFGKENYRVALKNGVKLKVSLSGYRLLKERLEL